ncbi:MAG: phosphoserine transaminase [Rickettsiales bacterium]
MKPSNKPQNPRFSSGPCSKRPGWSLAALEGALLGRSHRAKPCKERLAEAINRSRKILGIPEDYRLGIVAASDTGAMEMAMWSMLGPRGVDVFAWEAFGSDWITDCEKQLKIDNLNIYKGEYGQLPDISKSNWDNDVIFTWNGTTAGVRVPNGDWIPADRKGLSICDATSATFAMDLPWDKLDVVTWSWQKVLGGEAAHGMLALSPRAVERLESYTPDRPLPKLFRMTKGGKLNEGIFKGATINTPSMLCVEDAIDALKWAEQVGGLKGMIERSENNLKAVEAWVEQTPWIDFLAEDKSVRSCTSICLKIVDPWYQSLPADTQAEVAKKIVKLLEEEGVALDMGSYRDAPAGFRIWGGSTVETSDIEALFPWMEWAWNDVKNTMNQAA